MPTAKRKVAPPTLEQRARDLVAEAERIDATADQLLSELAEKYRPRGEGSAIPANWIRQNWATRARDENWRTVKVALEQNGG